MPADGIVMAKEAFRLVEQLQGYQGEEVLSYLFHAYGTNLQFDDGEFNFVKARAEHGTKRPSSSATSTSRSPSPDAEVLVGRDGLGISPHRGRQPRRGGDAADQRRARAARRARRRPPHDRPAHARRAARRCSCARPTRRCASTTTGRPAPAARTSTSPRSSGRCVAARADAAWVGWGFVAERPEFAELCDRLGIVFVGPSAEVMRRLGDKIGAKLLAEQAEVPVAPWSGGPVDRSTRPAAQAAAIGYPLMIKATAGGGGRGIRRVDDDAGLAEAFESARSEGLQGVRRPDGVHGAGRHRRPPRRGADHRRRPRHGVGGRRPRLQHAAAQPEGDRGVALHRAHARAGPRPAGRRRSASPRPPATSTPARSSSCTSRPSSASRSSRSTPGCRSSTR